VIDFSSVVGQTLGSYRLMEVLGQGGMGVVYLGEHALLGRKAAIKVLRPELSKRPDIIARFFNEARATSQVRHPSIVSCIDFGYDRSGSAFIVMEFLEGESLADRLEHLRRLPWARAVLVAKQVASALDAAHEVGVVHRDLKPDNVFLIPDSEVLGGERAKVLDFGIAKLAGDAGDDGVSSVFRTRTGSLMGTPVYMSPEQCRGAGKVDQRTDIYSLGCVLYQMVCGSPPFVAEGYGDLITMHITMTPAPPRALERSLPDWLDRVILRMLAKNPGERQGGMRELIAELERGIGNPGTLPQSMGAPVGPPLGSSPYVATGTPTTLGSSASESIINRRRAGDWSSRRWLWPLVLGVTLAGAAGAVAVATGGEGAEPPAAAAPIEPRPVAVADAGAPDPIAATPPVVDAAPAEVAEPPPPVTVDAAPARRAKPKRRSPRDENPAAPPQPRSTRVKGGIAEPDL
jgi:serine/threonine protein kinase